MKKNAARPPRKRKKPEPAVMVYNQVKKVIGFSKYKYLWIGSIALFVLFSVFTQKSGFGINLTRHNNEIDADERQTVHELNQMIIGTLKDKNFTFFKQFLSGDVGSSFDSLPQLYWKAKWFFDASPVFTVLNDYQIHSIKIGRFQASFPSETQPPFTFQTPISRPEMFVSMLASNDVNFQKFLLTLIYAKEDGQWKLIRLDLGTMEVGGMDANGWARRAQELHDKGEEAAAMLCLGVLEACDGPNLALRYPDEEKWTLLSKDVQKAVEEKYHFPIALDDVPGKPVVFSVGTEIKTEGPTLLVRYQTRFKMGQKRQIGIEAAEIRKSLQTALPGIEESAKRIDFLAFEQSPTDLMSQETIVDLN